jgi:hypothetical protein
VPFVGGISTGAGDPEGGPSAVRLQISLRRPRGYLSLLFRRCFPLPAGFRCWCGRWPLSGRWRGKSRRGPPGGAADQDRDVVVDGPAGVTGDGAEQRVQCARGWAPRPGAPGRPGRRARRYGRVSPSARRCRAAASPGRPSPDEYRRDKVLLGCSRLLTAGRRAGLSSSGFGQDHRGRQPAAAEPIHPGPGGARRSASGVNFRGRRPAGGVW